MTCSRNVSVKNGGLSLQAVWQNTGQAIWKKNTASIKTGRGRYTGKPRAPTLTCLPADRRQKETAGPPRQACKPCFCLSCSVSYTCQAGIGQNFHAFHPASLFPHCLSPLRGRRGAIQVSQDGNMHRFPSGNCPTHPLAPWVKATDNLFTRRME